jgi:hypothetical protein
MRGQEHRTEGSVRGSNEKGGAGYRGEEGRGRGGRAARENFPCGFAANVGPVADSPLARILMSEVVEDNHEP